MSLLLNSHSLLCLVDAFSSIRIHFVIVIHTLVLWILQHLPTITNLPLERVDQGDGVDWTRLESYFARARTPLPINR